MSSPFLAEIRMFAGNFAPVGWAMCNGQLLPISQNTALFSLVGTMYGGDGKSTFALPDMQGNAPMHAGDGSGLTSRFIGEFGGSATVTLLQSEIPQHTHTLGAQIVPLGTVADPTNATYGRPASGNAYSTSPFPAVKLAPMAVGIAGSSFPHNNMQPYLAVTFCIAMQGIYPQRP